MHKGLSAFVAITMLLSVSYLLFIELGHDDGKVIPPAGSTIQTKEMTGIEVSKSATTDTGAEPQLKPAITGKIHDVIKKEIKKKPKKIRVVLQSTGEDLDRIAEAVVQNDGSVDGIYSVGNSVIAEIPADKIELVAEENALEVWPEREYTAMLDEAVPNMGIPDVWNLGVNGSGIKVAVLDTGIDSSHEMLNGRVALSNVFTGEDHVEDRNGHGTHIAGIIAGDGKYRGVAPGASLLNAKVLTDTGGGTTSTIIKGINWAVENGADIISMSIGGTYAEPDSPVNNALRDAISTGVIVVVSAGNCGEGCANAKCGSFRGITTPGDSEDVITVGAVDKSNSLACFSSGQNFGSYIKPDVVAPGVDIRSSSVGSGYKAMSGTSMSAPFITGIAALMLEVNPDMSNAEVKRMFEENAIDLGDVGKDVQYGSGTVDVTKIFILNETPANQTENETQTSEPQDESNITVSNDTDAVNGNDSSLVIESDIGNNQFIEKSAFSEPDNGFFGEMAEYWNGEEYKLKVGVLVFENESFQQDFLDQNIRFTDTDTIESQELFFTQKDNYWFWNSAERFVWVLMPFNVSADMQTALTKYLHIYPPTPVYTIKKTSSDAATQSYESDSGDEDNYVFNDTFSSNEYCNDKCDVNSYKTDLSGGACNDKKNWIKKGTTYNDERGWTNTDTCKDSSTLKEYFLKCDYNNWAWCPTQGWYCYMDETFYTEKSCSSEGSNYVCSDGACVVGCSNNPTCTYTYKRVCTSSTDYDRYRASQACSGGCQYTYDISGLCNSGYYCSGTAYDAYPCYSCSTACDSSCQSSACYNIDPDCTSSGSPTRICCGDGLCSSGESCSSCGKDCGTCKKAAGESCGSDSDCLSGQCSTGTNKKCYGPCSQCDSPYWGECHNYGNLCCSGDSTFGQYYCQTDKSWALCTSSSHTNCQSKGSYYCTTDGSSWRWRTCSNGCDSSTGKCKVSNGGSCSQDSECVSGACAGGTGKCWDPNSCTSGQCQHWWMGHCYSYRDESHPELYCDWGNNRECSSSTNSPCQKYGDYYCTNDNGWQWRTCSNGCDSSTGKCKSVVCGDGNCDSGETCAKDCLKVRSFYQLPSSVDENSDIAINVVIENIGTVTQTGKVEVGIIPKFLGIFEYGTEGYSSDVTGCCEDNKFYDTREVTRNAGESQYTAFSLKAPAKFSVDECSTSNPKTSWWGSAFKVIAGAYDKCNKDGGSGYYSQIQQDITVKPLCADSQCTSYHWEECYNSGNLCCSGDDNDGSSDTVYGQFYCQTDKNWALCTSSSHTNCESKGSYYCATDGGTWKWRTCSNGCDSSTGKCIVKKANGQSCGSDNDCLSGNCSTGTNKKCYGPCSESSQCTSDYWGECYNFGSLCCSGDSVYGQYYCQTDTDWALCTSSSHTNCESKGSYYCATDGVTWKWRSCPLGCDSSTGKCKSVVCGDGVCQTGESCAKDCLKVRRFSELPGSFVEDDEVSVKVVIDNIGTISQTGKVEVGIIPKDFFSQEYGAQLGTSKSITGCCPANQYYAAREVTRDAGETGTYSVFTLNVTTKASVDACDTRTPKRSAWGSSFEAVAGAYDLCSKDGGDGYYSEIKQDITVTPLCASNKCTSYRWEECYNSGNLCCSGDDNDGSSNTVYGQFYCQTDKSWALCTSSSHTNCESKGSYYCAQDSYGIWKFRDCQYGCNSATGKCNTAACAFPYGSSPECSCYEPAYKCGTGYVCSSEKNGMCVPEVPQQCNKLPDGSSEYCQCSSDKDCTKYQSDTYCSFEQGFNRCLPKTYTDKCGTVDELRCTGNVLYRCEQRAKYKDWALVEGCTSSQLCSEAQGKCVNLGKYDMIIDSAPAGVIVNKQPETFLKVNIKVDGTLEPGLQLSYDDSNFNLDDGNCNTASLKQGDNICYFEVTSVIDKSHIFKFGEDSQRINIVGNDVPVAYLTNEKQLRRRYNDNKAVDLMLSKLYQEAVKNNGVVHDLDVQFKHLNYNVQHPFDKAFWLYSEDRLFPKMTDNSYADQVASFVQDYLSYARNVVIVGDDYVVPHRRDVYSVRAGSLPIWLRPWYNTIKSDSRYLNYVIGGHSLGSITPTIWDYMDDDIVVRNMYTDQQIVQRDINFDYSNIDIVFRTDDKVRANEVKVILPDTVSTEMRNALDHLRKTLIKEKLMEDEPFTELKGSKVHCNDFNTFSDAWFFDPLDVPILVGTPENNPAFNCYPMYSAEDFEDVISIEPSVWNANGAAIVINTNDPRTVNAFADDVIANKQYETLHGRAYMYFHDTVSVVSLVLIPVSFGTSAYAGVALKGAVLAVDLLVTAVDAADNCWIRDGGKLPSGFSGWISCGLSAAPLGAYGAGELISAASKSKAVSSFMKSAEKFSGTADEIADAKKAAASFITSSGEAGDVLRKIPKGSHERFLKMLSKGMNAEADFLNSQFAKSLTKVLQKSNLKRSVLQNNPEIIDVIGDVVKKHANKGDDVLESIAKISSKGDGTALSIVKSSDNVWSKAELEKLGEFDDATLRQYDELVKRYGRCGLFGVNEFTALSQDSCAAKARETLQRLRNIGKTDIIQGIEELGKYLPKSKIDAAITNVESAITLGKGVDGIKLQAASGNEPIKLFLSKFGPEQLSEMGQNHVINSIKRLGFVSQEFKSKGWVHFPFYSDKGLVRGESIGRDVNELLKKGITPKNYNSENRDLVKHIIDDKEYYVREIKKTAFVSTTTKWEKAIIFATGVDHTKKGYVYFINPRGGMGINSFETLKGTSTDDIAVLFSKTEAEITIPDWIYAEDILGAVPVDDIGKPIGKFISNKGNYIGDLDSDLSKLFPSLTEWGVQIK